MMIQAPISVEEKSLREKYDRLKAIRKQLISSKQPSQLSKETTKSSDRSNKKSTVEVAAVAAEEVKKKIISGAITLSKASEKSTFKRLKVLDKRPSLDKSVPTVLNEPGSCTTPEVVFSPPYSTQEPRFSKQPQPKQQTPTRGPTLYIRGIDLVRDVLEKAFTECGPVVRCHVEDRRRSAFITFASTEQAEEAMNKMDDTELDGRTINVSFARRQNQAGFPNRQNQQRSFNRQRTISDAEKESGNFRKRPGIGSDRKGGEGPTPLRRWTPSNSTDTSAPTTPITPNASGTNKMQFQKFVPASGSVTESCANRPSKPTEEKQKAPSGRSVVTYDDSCPFD